MESSDKIEQIRELVHENDPSALDAIYDVFGKRLYHYLLTLLRDRSEAEDVQHDVFMRLARNLERLGRMENISGYLFATARNLALNARRKRRTRREENLDEYAQILSVESDDSSRAEERKMVLEALRVLPLEQREVVTMKCWQGMTFDEIARALKISLNTAASRYRYALEKMRGILEE